MQKVYKIETIKDLFDVIDPRNVDRFIDDLNNTIRRIVEVKNRGINIIVNDIEWTDDDVVECQLNMSFKMCTCATGQINPYGNIPQECLICKGIIIKYV